MQEHDVATNIFCHSKWDFFYYVKIWDTKCELYCVTAILEIVTRVNISVIYLKSIIRF